MSQMRSRLVIVSVLFIVLFIILAAFIIAIGSVFAPTGQPYERVAVVIFVAFGLVLVSAMEHPGIAGLLVLAAFIALKVLPPFEWRRSRKSN